MNSCRTREKKVAINRSHYLPQAKKNTLELQGCLVSVKRERKTRVGKSHPFSAGEEGGTRGMAPYDSADYEGLEVTCIVERV